ncbi:MAG TPA: phage protease [Candidatus Eisenbacteria bacterium]|nr:phage protease [Candidatus Eisenbacteria bacterium]
MAGQVNGTFVVFVSTFVDGFKGSAAKAEILKTSPPDGWLYKGEVMKITRSDLEQIVANWKKYPREIPLDYEHGSAYDGPVGSAIAAGWLRDLEIQGDALVGTFELTDRATEWVSNGEYRLTSSEFNTNYVHPEAQEPIGMYLLAVGLTNRPFVNGLAPMTMLSEAAARAIEHRTAEHTKTTRIFRSEGSFTLRQGDE